MHLLFSYRLLIQLVHVAVPQTTFSTTTTNVSVFPRHIVRLDITGILINVSVDETVVVWRVTFLRCWMRIIVYVCAPMRVQVSHSILEKTANAVSDGPNFG